LLEIDRPTAYRWLLHQRVEQAKNLMVRSEPSLGKLAFASGFVGAAHFARLFTRHTSVRPTA